MSQNRTDPTPKVVDVTHGDMLPQNLRARFNGQLDDQQLVAWAQYDLDEDNRYTTRYAVLTERALLLLKSETEPPAELRISDIEEAKIVEGLGVDRMNVIAKGECVAELRYSPRHRRGITRLHRKLERRLPTKAGSDVPPDWLETVEREAEAKETCTKCGEIIPAYAEGVCPRCQQTRKVLWRLLDIARPYRGRVWAALALTLLVSMLTPVPPIFLRYLIDGAVDPEGTAAHLSADARMRNLVWWSLAIVAAVIVTQLFGGA